MRKLLLSTAAAVALSSGAMAADLPVRGPAMAPAPIFVGMNWSGFYVGGQVGWANAHNDAAVFVAGAPVAGWAQGYSANGFVGGLYAGWAHQSGSLVYGVELDANYNSVSKSVNSIGTLAFFPGDSVRVRAGFEGALVGKLGFAIGGSAMIYALAGGTLAQFDTRYNLPGTFGLLQSNDDTRFGWTVGAGAAMKFAPNWSARIEYRYSNFGSENHVLGATPVSVRHEIDSHRVTVGLTHHFGGPAGAVVAKY